MFIWKTKGTTETTASPENIWALWSDVTQWSTWDHDLDWVKLDGAFAANVKGQLKPKGWKPLDFTITQATKNKSFTDVTTMPLGTRLKFHHWIDDLGNGTYRITHQARVSGLLAPLLWFTLRRNLKKDMPIAVQTLAKRAEQKGK